MTAPDREREAREAKPAEADCPVCTNGYYHDDRGDSHRCYTCDAWDAYHERKAMLHAKAQEAERAKQAANDDAIRDTERSAWRAAIEGMRKEHGSGCIEDEGGWICACGANDWNAALAALAERMGTDDPPRDAQPARLSGDPC